MYDLSVDHVATLFRTVVKDSVSSEEFVSGLAGNGMKIYKAINGDWNMEIDNLTVRKIFSIFELVVQKILHQGGMVIRSAAGGRLTKVTDSGSYWHCEHDSTDDFVTGDQILCQTFTGTTIKRYWRLVTSAGAGYFNLSKTDCEANSAIPEAGDDVAVLGNRTVTARQSAQIDCAVGDTAPYRDDYEGINSYSLEGKLITRVGNLSGIVDAVFGALSGSGLYGKNVRLKGDFILESTGKSVTTELSEVKTSISTVQTTLSVLDGRITASVTETKSYADSVSSVSKQAAIDDAATKYTTKSDFSAQVDILSTQITTKVSQTDFNALGQRVTSAETSITQQAGLISLKADQSGVDSLATRVASAELKITSTAIISTVQSTINSAKDSAISAAAADATTKSNNAQSAATSAAATDASNKVNAIKIGGRNLLYKSLKATWGIATTSDFLTFSCNAPQGSSTGVRMDIKNSMELNTRYTLSYKIKILSGGLYHIGGHDGGFGNCYNLRVNDVLLTDNFSSGNAYTPSVPYTTVNSILKISYELQISATPTDYFYIQPNRGTTFEAISYILYDIKFEKGNKVTDWTPAPEDVDASIAAVLTVANAAVPLTTYTTKIAQLDSSISLKADSSTVSGIDTRLSSAELKITSTAIISTVQSTIDSAKSAAISAAASDAATKANNAQSAAISSATATAAADATTKANNAQTNATNAAATDATNKVNAIQIGGKNILTGSKDWLGWSGSGVAQTAIQGGFIPAYYDNSAATSGYIELKQLNTVHLKPSTTYTLSFWSKGAGYLYSYVYPNVTQLFVSNSDVIYTGGNDTICQWALTSEYKKHWVTFTTLSSLSETTAVNCLFRLVYGNAGYVYGAKLELGTKATDWTPSPEDVDASIAAVLTVANAAVPLTTYTTKMIQLDSSISLKAESSTVSAIDTRLSTAETKITPSAIISTVQSTVDAAKNAAISDAASKYTTISTYNTKMSQLDNSISLKADSTTVSAIDTRLASAETKITPSAIISTVSSTVATAKSEAISAAATDATNKANTASAKSVVTIDATGLDINKYYPITIQLNSTKPYDITVERNLDSSMGVPSWSTHGAGLSVICKWTSNGYGWGTIPINRIIHIYTYNWSNVIPVGTIGQIDTSSLEYIYVRGGSKYNVTVEGSYGVGITLRTASYTINGQTINVLDSVTAPTVTITEKSDAAKNAAISDAASKYTTITTYNTQIAQLNNAISLKATQTDLNSLTGRVSTAEGSITTMAGQISSKVSSTDYNGNTIASMINQTTTTIKLTASKIALEGYTTINDNFIINLDGSISAKNATFTGTVKASAGNIGSFAIDNGDIVGVVSGVEKIRLSTGTITSLSSIYSGDWQQLYGAVNINDNAPVYQNVYYDTVEGLIVGVTETYDLPQKTIVLSTMSSIRINGLFFSMQDQDMFDYYSIKSYSIGIWNSTGTTCLYSSTNFSNATFSNIPAGTYLLNISVQSQYRGTLNPDNYSGGIARFGIALGYSSIQILASITRTMIGNNGIYSVFGATNYMYYSKDDGFEVKYASAGIKVNAVSVQKWDGSVWKNIVDKKTYYLTTTTALYIDTADNSGQIDYILSNCSSVTTVYLPSNPSDGRTIHIRKMNNGNCNVYGNGHSVYGNGTATSVTVTNNDVVVVVYVASIGYWMRNYYSY